MHGVLRVLLIVTAVVWLGAELWQSRRIRPEAKNADSGSHWVLRGAYVFGVVLTAVAGRLLPDAVLPDRVVIGWVGLAVLSCGAGLRIWSFRTLGRYFTFTVQTSGDQPVISGGPYRVLRHPSYTGLLLVVVGIALLVGTWPPVVILPVVTVAGLAYRIHVEERALLDELGDAYRDFAASRKRLVPFVW